MTRLRTPLFLSVSEVSALHEDQLRLYGGSQGLRDVRMLESAVATPAATYDGEFLHEDVFHTAAAYAFHIAENQPFLDGNKRTGLNAALVFLDINGWVVSDIPNAGQSWSGTSLAKPCATEPPGGRRVATPKRASSNEVAF